MLSLTTNIAKVSYFYSLDMKNVKKELKKTKNTKKIAFYYMTVIAWHNSKHVEICIAYCCWLDGSIITLVHICHSSRSHSCLILAQFCLDFPLDDWNLIPHQLVSYFCKILRTWDSNSAKMYSISFIWNPNTKIHLQNHFLRQKSAPILLYA